MSTPPEPAKHDAYAAFRVPSYRLYTIVASLSTIGMTAQGLAIGLEIYKRTQDAFLLGLVGLTTAAPMMVFILPAGMLADLFDRRKVIVISAMGMAVASVALAIVSHVEGTLWLMFLTLFVNASASTLGRPARTALLPQLVPREVFENSVAWRTSVQQVSSMVGPPIGAFIAISYIPAVYVIAAITSLVFAATLPFLRLYDDQRERRERPSFSTVLAGARFVWNTKLLLATMALDLFAVLLGGAVYLLPVFALDILDVGESGLGWLRAMPAAGAFCMALVVAHMPPMKKAGRNLLLAVAGFGVATIIFGLSRNFWLSMAMLFLTGAFDNISVVVRHTLMQLLTPNEMRGRVSAVSSVFIGSSNQLGGFESGTVAKLTTPLISVVSGGIGTLIVVIGMAFASPQLRRLRALGDVDAKR